MNRRKFIGTSTGALLHAKLLHAADTVMKPIALPADHREAVRRRRRRIVVQCDANDTLFTYWKVIGNDDTPFDRFRDALFSCADEPGSQIDAIWWDIGGSPLCSPYPSKVLPPVGH